MHPLFSIKPYEWKSRPGYAPVSKPVYQRGHSMGPKGSSRRAGLPSSVRQAGNQGRDTFSFRSYIIYGSTLSGRTAQKSGTVFTMNCLLIYSRLTKNSGIRKKYKLAGSSSHQRVEKGVCFCQGKKKTQEDRAPGPCWSRCGDIPPDDSAGFWNLGRSTESLLLPGVR